MSACYDPVGLTQFFLANSSTWFAGHFDVTDSCREILNLDQSPTEFSPAAYLLTFLMTCVFEAPIYLLALRKSHLSIAKRATLIVVLNLATHPFVYFFFPWVFTQGGGKFFQTLAVAEVFAPLVETVILKNAARISWRKAAVWAIAANLFSWWLGVILHY